MFSQAFIRLFFPFVASAVLILIIPISSPAKANVALGVVSVEVRLFSGLATEVSKWKGTIQTTKK
jgi:hypothetical protein